MDQRLYSTVVSILMLLAGFANAQSPCETPKKTPGLCIEINQCPTLYALLQSTNRKAEDGKFLRDSQCGATGKIPKVCCEDDLPCTTPSGEQAKCTKFASCQPLVTLIRSFPGALPDAVKTYLRDSACQGVDKYSVCCGQTAPDFSTPAPPVDLDAVLDAKRCGILASEEKIFGGTEAAIDQYPWLTLMEYRAPNQQIKLLCGAVLIGPKYVLTAGHCVKGEILTLGTPVSVRLGEHDITNEGRDCQVPPGGGEDCNDGAQSIAIEEIVAHPNYNPSSSLKRDDIALVRLRTTAPYTDFIRHICMPTIDVSLNLQSGGLNFSVAGWGSTETNRVGSKLKLFVVVPFKTLQECQAKYVGRLAIRLWDKQMCAGGVTGKDSCRGDSGGPLMFNNAKNRYEVIGIVSFGPTPCGMAGVPGVYSKVTEYMDWMRSVIRP